MTTFRADLDRLASNGGAIALHSGLMTLGVEGISGCDFLPPLWWSVAEKAIFVGRFGDEWRGDLWTSPWSKIDGGLVFKQLD